MPPPPAGSSLAPSGGQAPSKAISVKTQASRPPAPSASLAGHRKRVDLASLAAEVPGAQRALRSMASASQKGKAIYSPPAKHWERGESSGVNALIDEPLSPKWEVSRKRFWWRKDLPPEEETLAGQRGMARHPPQPRPPSNRDAYKERLAGWCFHCLSLDHQVAQCRDPIHCLRCRCMGHTSSSALPTPPSHLCQASFPASLPGQEHPQQTCLP